MDTKLYTYQVEGHGTFPVDMLRYDAAWPRDGVDVTAIENATGRHHHDGRVQLRSYQMPTEERWRSFGWSISTLKYA